MLLKQLFTLLIFISTPLVLFSQTNTEIISGSIPFKKEPYSHISRQENIRDALLSFADSQKINISVDDSVTGIISGEFIDQSPKDYFLNYLMKPNNLAWFYDGALLYITSKNNVKSAMLDLSYTTPEKLMNVYKILNFSSSDWSIRSLPEENLLLISGPSIFVDTMQELAQKVEGTLYQKDLGEDTVEVFPLTYAWSYDHTYEYGDNTVLVPGIASLLQSLLSGQSNTARLGVVTKQGITQIKAGLDQQIPETGYASAAIPPSSQYESKVSDSSPKEKKDPSKPSGNAPLNIIADPRTNSVIVKDSRNKMPLYKKLVETLDTPVKVIEITAAIVEVSKGSNYNFSNNLSQLTLRDGNPVLFSATGGFLSSSDITTDNTNIQFQGSVDGNVFLQAIQALEAKNKAKTLSRPTILTLDNLQAVIDRKERRYVQVEAERFANLFDTNVGLTLRVTPHVIEDPNQRRIRLLVNVEDGNFLAGSSEAVPVSSSQNSINTQAIIDEGQSLLIGGNYETSDTRTESGIPFLKDLPILGILFKSVSRTKACEIRFYLITPRVIETLASCPKYKSAYTSSENFKAPGFLDCGPTPKESSCEDVSLLRDTLEEDKLLCPIYKVYKGISDAIPNLCDLLPCGTKTDDCAHTCDDVPCLNDLKQPTFPIQSTPHPSPNPIKHPSPQNTQYTRPIIPHQNTESFTPVQPTPSTYSKPSQNYILPNSQNNCNNWDEWFQE